MERIVFMLFVLHIFSFELHGNVMGANVSENKLALRYGFQQTQDCKNFHKAYMCIKECLELGFAIAKSDKQCKCRCFKSKDYDIFFGTARTTRSFPVPTTRIPAWAGGNRQPKLGENHANLEGYNDTSLYSMENADNDSKTTVKADEGSREKSDESLTDVTQDGNDMPNSENDTAADDKKDLTHKYSAMENQPTTEVSADGNAHSGTSIPNEEKLLITHDGTDMPKSENDTAADDKKDLTHNDSALEKHPTTEMSADGNAHSGASIPDEEKLPITHDGNDMPKSENDTAADDKTDLTHKDSALEKHPTTEVSTGGNARSGASMHNKELSMLDHDYGDARYVPNEKSSPGGEKKADTK